MTYRFRTVLLHCLLVVLYALCLGPILLADPANGEPARIILPLSAAAYPACFFAVVTLIDAVVARTHSRLLRGISGLTAILHLVGWGSWVWLLTTYQATAINITGVVAPLIGCVLSFIAIGMALLVLRRPSPAQP